MKKINMIGLGYIGLPTAAVMAKSGYDVIGVDINEDACKTINQGRIHIVEPGLESVVKDVVGKGRLVAQTTPTEADVFVIAVPTPFKDSYAPDLTFIKAAATSIAPFLQKGSLVVLESTSPVGTTHKLKDWLSELRPDLTFPTKSDDVNSDVNLAYCPERVLPGKVLEELVANDRSIGGITPSCSEKAQNFYQFFVDGECVITDAKTAEMTKLTENSFRDVNIAFANELSLICDRLDINVWELIELANRHPRVSILQPGCGVGGHCIAVDPWFIVDSAPAQAKLIRQAREINDAKPEWVAQKVQSAVFDVLHSDNNKSLSDVRVACFGLAFKPNIDDLRESPAVEVVRHLCEKYPNQTIEVCEPHMTGDLPASLQNYDNLRVVSIDEGLSADVKGVLVAHDDFKTRAELLEDGVVNVAWDTRKVT
jgi:UDP-N-acetyl-D-mannosaminuronic acid dehydrogenase